MSKTVDGAAAVPPTMTDLHRCPCNSGLAYAACCRPLLTGAGKAATAEALMRSRYTAYVVRAVEYLLNSWHPATRPAAIDPASITDWHDLQIVRTAAGRAGDHEGIVEFMATALSPHGAWQLHEVSRFSKEGGLWFYVDGDILPVSPPLARTERLGRNEPCPCASGKKFKKCCGSRDE